MQHRWVDATVQGRAYAVGTGAQVGAERIQRLCVHPDVGLAGEGGWGQGEDRLGIWP